MRPSNLKKRFLSALPVIGPHTFIEADLMLSGKKPITWTPVFSDDTEFGDMATKTAHEGRKRLDEAVVKGQLISIDVQQSFPDQADHVVVIRHYAQTDQKDKLAKVVSFNEAALNRREITPDIMLDQDMGHYLGYRKRDIFLFNHIINSRLLPDELKEHIIDLNSASQHALRDVLLEGAGYDTDKWYAQHTDPTPNSAMQ